MRCMRGLIIGLVGCFALSACSTIQFDELASGSAATGAAVVGTAVAGPVGGVIAGTGATVVTSVVTPKSGDGIDLNLVPKEDRAGVAKWDATLTVIEHFGFWIAIGLAGWFLFPLVIGYFLPNGKQRKLMKDAHNDPKNKL